MFYLKIAFYNPLALSLYIFLIREDCRQIVQEYLLNYALGKSIDQTLHFYVSQLEYEMIAGRESAVQMLETIFKLFPTVSSIGRHSICVCG